MCPLFLDTKVLLLRYDLSKWWICSGKCFLIVYKTLSWFTLSNAFSMSMKRAIQYCFFSIASKFSLTSLCICSIMECLFLNPNW